MQCPDAPILGEKSGLDRIARTDAIRWFETRSREAPGAANKALQLLRQILNHAVSCGHITANSTRGMRRNPGKKLTRFLSREEIARLHQVLDHYADGPVRQAQQADIIRLLLLTGCRSGEIVYLRRDEVKEDQLELKDSKTGPRTVMLNAEAREIWTGACSRRTASGSSRPSRTRRGAGHANPGSGMPCGAKPASRMSACTTFVTRLPARRR